MREGREIKSKKMREGREIKSKKTGALIIINGVE
jgi:hypothetical protein